MGGPSRDLQRVAVAKQKQNLVEPRTARFRAARVVDVDVLLGDAGAPQRVELVLDLPGLGPRSGGINSRQADVPPAEQMVFAVVRREVEAIGTLIITQQLVERDLVDERGREWLASRRQVVFEAGLNEFDRQRRLSSDAKVPKWLAIIRMWTT